MYFQSYYYTWVRSNFEPTVATLAPARRTKDNKLAQCLPHSLRQTVLQAGIRTASVPTRLLIAILKLIVFIEVHCILPAVIGDYSMEVMMSGQYWTGDPSIKEPKNVD